MKVHGCFVDYVVVGRPEYSRQHYFDAVPYHPEWTGEVRVPMGALEPMELGIRKIIARRGAMELRRECLVNLGFGMPDGVASVAGEEGVAGEMTLSIESGTLGGVPAPGNGAAAPPPTWRPLSSTPRFSTAMTVAASTSPIWARPRSTATAM